MSARDIRLSSSSTPNREAYLFLGMLMERTGLRKAALLARLAELGHDVSDNTFTNWGRPGRSFPRDWALITDILRLVSQPERRGRCTADEALRFSALVQMPFTELRAVSSLFPLDEFAQALMAYLPEELLSLQSWCRHEHTASLSEVSLG